MGAKHSSKKTSSYTEKTKGRNNRLGSMTESLSSISTAPVSRSNKKQASPNNKIKSIDVSFRQDRHVARGQVMIDHRESHTANLEEFDNYMKQMHTKNASKEANTKLWQYVRSTLEQHGQPAGFAPQQNNEEEDNAYFMAHAKKKSDAFVEKFIGLDLINPINPATIANAANIPMADILTELVQSTIIGLTTLRFAPICKRCGGQVSQEADLTHYGVRDHEEEIVCRMCCYANHVSSMDQIGAFFFLHPSVLYVLAKNWGCYDSKRASRDILFYGAVPANGLKVGCTYTIGCASDTDIFEKTLAKGRYRGRCGVSGSNYILEVQGDAPADPNEIHHDEIKVSYLVPPEIVTGVQSIRRLSSIHPTPILTVPHGRLKLDILPDTKSMFLFGIRGPHPVSDNDFFTLPEEERSVYTSACDIMNHPSFQNNSSVSKITPDLLKLGGELDTGHVTLIFTDVVKSTDMYGKLGDWKALSLVRQHFEILFAAFSKWGRVVKTVGDAVMAAFASGEAAIQAAAQALRVIQTEMPPDFQIRIGIHSGSALVLPVNGINDYFGQTVNRAARIEGKAPPNGCLLSKDVLRNNTTALNDILAGSGNTEFERIAPMQLDLKGIGELTEAVGFLLVKKKPKKTQMIEYDC
mmetsp:Transcript_26934/g.39839  ORF Transcript_26934/g.39839 Transcript_26934/m.39839 type:complete len:637 (-) Transcript_26934:21-1931(-)